MYVYKSEKKVSKLLKYHNGCLTLTTSGWSSRVAKSYITITAYLIDDNWKLKDYVLCTSELENTYTGNNIYLTLCCSCQGLGYMLTLNEEYVLHFTTKISGTAFRQTL